MRSYLNGLRKNAGFTLIELLVVIGILGVLAAALIATIDPFEQIKKANDSNTKNAAVEYVDASIRYYTTHNNLPWSDLNISTTCRTSGLPSGAQLTAAQMADCTNVLVSDGELKSNFATSNYLSSIYVTGTANSVVACFLPTSKSQLKDPNTKYTIAGAAVANPNTNCTGWGGGTTCYWCAL